MAFKPTEMQSKAIDTAGNLLVSAAAGSGKTAVLVERVIKKLCSKTNGISADKLLIVTFTNAAAAEMRGRIEKRLEEEIINNPDDTSLLMQKHLLSGAKICTIDSFCIDLVRENFDKLGISPDFTISDGNSLRPINEQILLKIVNRYLEEENAVFDKLLDIIGAEYNEGNFLQFVYSIYEYSRQLPFPKRWFKSLSENYNGGSFNKDNIWYKYLFERANTVISESKGLLAEAVDLLTVSKKAADSYLPSFIELSNSLNYLLTAAQSDNWDTLYNALESFTAPKLPVVRGVSDIYEVNAAKDIYKYTSVKAIEGLKKLFYADSMFINLQFEKLYEPLCLLSDILIEYENELFSEYKKQNTFTFHNTEHLALSLLCEQSEKGIKFKDDADGLIARFEEVMVDEYQDTNDLQDMLFYVLSDKERKLFAVGDIKQSIYGFRGANPKNFLIKKNKYVPIEKATEDMPKKIILGNNFRCKPEVCDYINFLFSLFMTEKTGDIVYSEEEKLIASAEYPETDGIATKLHLINTKGADIGNIQIEARDIAGYIKKTMSEGAVIRAEDGTLRNAKYSDFTILLRSAKLNAPKLAAELKKSGIPVTYNIENFAESMEIKIFLNLLCVIDNPRSDVELLSVMMSPVFAFSPEEMAKIRISQRDESLYIAVLNAASEGDKKADSFLKTIEKFRLYAAVNPLTELMNILLQETEFLLMVTAMTDGLRRRNNLLLLCEYANQFCGNSNSSIGSFVKYINKQSQTGMKAAGTLSGADSVKIMSIHASKGLQFPVCILAGLSSDFNDSEARENTLYSTEFGIGFKYYDETDKERYTTVSREAIIDKIRIERLREEERLLYVAMTRTQDRLFMTATMSDVYKKSEELKTMLISSGSEIDFNVFSRTKSYSDWLMLSLLLHPCGKELRGSGNALAVHNDSSVIDVSVIDYETVSNDNYKETTVSGEADNDLINVIKHNIDYKYPYAEILDLESKASVSKLANSAESVKYAFSYKPSFMNDGGMTPSERGTAMHKVMQFFDFSKTDSIDEELERLYEWQFISEAEYNSINKRKLCNFFKSGVFERIKNSSIVKREMRFLTEVPAVKLAPELDSRFQNEKIIIQGAVDICFVEEDGVVVLDFKTDRADTQEDLINAYGEQLNIYAAACEKIFEMPVKQKIIYSFALSEEIGVE